MTILDRLRLHNTWMTRELLERCRPLSREQFLQQFEIGPGSLHDTFLHIIGTMNHWADRIGERPKRADAEDADETLTIDELISRLDAAAADLDAVMHSIECTDRLEEMMEVKYEDRVYRFTRGTAIAHVLTHGMHHRAQLFNMFRQLDFEVDLDGDVIEWEIATV